MHGMGLPIDMRSLQKEVCASQPSRLSVEITKCYWVIRQRIPAGERNGLAAFQHYSSKELEEACAELRLPGAYLREGEHPDETLDRVMKDQLGVKKYGTSLPLVFSWYSPSDWYPGKRHWGLLFAYKVKAQAPSKIPSWWRDLSWVNPSALHACDFGWNRELMHELRLVRS